jgi:hypothetical protein
MRSQCCSTRSARHTSLPIESSVKLRRERRYTVEIHISHGLGVFTFGLLCLLVATHDFTLVERIDAIRPLTIAFSAAYLALSLRFWFYGPAIITATPTACLTVATVLSA